MLIYENKRSFLNQHVLILFCNIKNKQHEHLETEIAHLIFIKKSSLGF